MKTRLVRLTATVRPAAAHVRERVEPIVNYILFMLAVGVAISVVIFVFEGSGLPSGAESRSALVRNVGLVIGGTLALWVAVWRSRVADRQAKAAQRQANTAQQQADIAHRGLLNERYQEGAAMLGRDVLAVRLAGIYSLQHLAEEQPEEYHIQIMRLLCAFVRHPARDERTGTTLDTHGRPDVHAAMEAISAGHRRRKSLEEAYLFELDLRGSDLRQLRSFDLHLADADLSSADLSGAILFGAHLRSADLADADLSGAVLFEANLSNCDFSGSGLAPAKGLTQAQLDSADQRSTNPPRLEGVVDAETGEPLVWRGEPLEDTA